jgi:hypothetical protein
VDSVDNGADGGRAAMMGLSNCEAADDEEVDFEAA